jgi:hypothetical protein
VVQSRKQDITLSDLGSSLRLYNYIKKLRVNQDQIESFIANLADSPEPGRLIDVANRVAHLSISELIPLEKLEGHLKQKEEEKQTLEEEIKQRRAISQSTDVEIQTINEYKKLRAELSKHHLSSEDPNKLVTVLHNIRHYATTILRKSLQNSLISNR